MRFYYQEDSFNWSSERIGKRHVPDRKLSVSSLVSTFGTAAIAANSVANSVTMFANIPGNAIGMAMITVIGQCIGAKKPDEAKRYGKKLMFIAYAGILATNIIMTIVAVPVVGLFHCHRKQQKQV